MKGEKLEKIKEQVAASIVESSVCISEKAADNADRPGKGSGKGVKVNADKTGKGAEKSTSSEKAEEMEDIDGEALTEAEELVEKEKAVGKLQMILKKTRRDGLKRLARVAKQKWRTSFEGS